MDDKEKGLKTGLQWEGEAELRERFFRNRNDKCIYIENGASRRKKAEYEKEAIFAGKKSRKLLEDNG